MGQLRSIMDRIAPSPFEFHENEVVEVPAAPRRPQLLTVRVDLGGSEPPIWRRLELRGDLRLDRVHDHLQAAMGWTNSHLHRFSAPNTDVHQGNYFVTEFDIDEGDAGTPETDVRLDQVLRTEGEFINYEYDFGDGWTHKLVVESIRNATENHPERAASTGRAPGRLRTSEVSTSGTTLRPRCGRSTARANCRRSSRTIGNGYQRTPIRTPSMSTR
ncbi:plasmid pRiA4b ORF-3 family protein [Yimella sp. cx-51]|nr:plasmid pRiA4b ORF-3 family protein [Yimella sp. cx-51]MBC9958381.1 plasmid pRiA4b ORF-3 family protein [Yimella sp. cx-51]